MFNPLRYVQNVRTVYSRFYQKNIKEVEVQFDNEEPAWIPYDTLLSIMSIMGIDDVNWSNQIRVKEDWVLSTWRYWPTCC